MEIIACNFLANFSIIAKTSMLSGEVRHSSENQHSVKREREEGKSGSIEFVLSASLRVIYTLYRIHNYRIIVNSLS